MPQFRHGDILLEAPEGWYDASSVVVVGPLNPQLRMEPRVVVSRQNLVDPISPSELGQSFAESLPEALPGSVVVESQGGTVGGLPAHRLVYRWQAEGIPEMIRMQVFITRGQSLFVMTSEAPAEAFPTVRPMLDQVMGSFRFAAPGT